MWHNSWMSQSTTFMYVIMPQFPWMSQYDIHLMNVAMWQRHCCMSHCDMYFDVRRNVTLNLMYVTMWHYLWWCFHVTSTLMNVEMWHSSMETTVNYGQPWWMKFNHGHWGLTMVIHGQSWSTTINHDQVRSSTVYRGHP